MKKNPLVSVIVNCFNGEIYLEQTLKSLFSQTYYNWELIFWDNQSKDSTKNIVCKFNDSRIKYYYAPSHTSLSEARHLALNKINGQLFCFLDSDDIWIENKLELQVNQFLLYPNIGFTYSKFSILYDGVNTNNKQLNYYKSIKIKSHEPKNIYNKLLFGNFIIFSSVLFQKFEDGKHIFLNKHFNQNEDYDYLLKYSLYYDCSCIELETTLYRIHDFNNSNKNVEINYLENEIIYKNLPYSKNVEFAQKKIFC